MDIEKTFDLLDDNILISSLEKYGFGQNFILKVKILLKDQESCVFMVVKPQITFCLVEVLVRVTQFQYFNLF